MPREAERERLLPLPEHPFPTDVVKPIASGKTPYVRVDRNDYSIPHTLARKPLTLVASQTTVRVCDGLVEVALHARSFDAGHCAEDPTHLRGLAVVKRAAHELRGRDRLRAACPAADAFFDALATRGAALARPARRLGQILDQYGAKALDRAIAEVLTRGSVSVESIEHVLTQHARAGEATARVAIPLPDRVGVRALTVTPHALAPYDDLAQHGDAQGDRKEGEDDE